MLDVRYHNLFATSKSVTEYLDGFVFSSIDQAKLAPVQDIKPVYAAQTNQHLFTFDDNSDKLSQIYQHLQIQYQEAGQAYWLTRLWGLLTWQGVYTSLLSVYRLGAVPDFSSMAQVWQPKLNFISGYGLNGADFYSDDKTHLIEKVGADLVPVFNQYREQLAEHVRIRPHFCNQILADSFVVCLTRLQHQAAKHMAGIDPDLAKFAANISVTDEAQLWLNAFELPSKSLANLTHSKTGDWLYTRTSCCLAYRTKGGGVCSNCPRKK